MKFFHLQQYAWTWRAFCQVKYVRERKTTVVSYHYMQNLKKKHNKSVNKTKKKQT